MKTTENVQSNVFPSNIEYDEQHVYLNTNIVEVPEEERTSEIEQLEEGQTLSPMYRYTVTEYEKDEFLSALQAGQVTLDTRATTIEDMILEMSGTIYA